MENGFLLKDKHFVVNIRHFSKTSFKKNAPPVGEAFHNYDLEIT